VYAHGTTSAADSANHVDQETDVQPEEGKADERSGGRDGQPGTNQLVSRLKLLHGIHLRTVRHLAYSHCHSQNSCFIITSLKE